MNCATYIAWFIMVMTLNAQGTNAGNENSYPERGKIIDTVRCKLNPKFSYALYLPDNYSDTVKWPIIYIFDPAARGRVRVTWQTSSQVQL